MPNDTAHSALFAPPMIVAQPRADGAILLRSTTPLAPYARCVGDWLVDWAARTSTRVFLAERPAGDPAQEWTKVTYAQALQRVEAMAAWMITRELNPQRPLVILSDNGIEHALLMLAAMHMGAPSASISPAYSLISTDHAKLRHVVGLLNPGAIYAPSLKPFSAALAAIKDLHKADIIIGDGDIAGADNAVALSTIEASSNPARVAKAFADITPDTIAKFLFTSGSTGDPKGVINTQRMLCMSQQAKAQIWPFVETTPPVILDWLPWSHTFGSNHNFNLVLRNGGTLYIDGGKPAPGIFNRTLANLRATSSNIHFNVPRGFDLLASELRNDKQLAEHVFKHLKLVFYAGAALPQNVWDELTRLSLQATGSPIAMVSAWGSTETSPLATDCHFQADRAGNIGVPAPGIDIKLVPNGGKLEIRVRGANIMPGYWKRDDLTKAAFDEEGFYIIGDAVRFADEQNPNKGLFFDGRVAEDFKLTSGTRVSVGALRLRGVEQLAPIAQDIVVTGHDRAEIGFLIFANLPACRQLAGVAEDARADEALAHPKVKARVKDALAALKSAGGGSSTYAARALLMAEPPSVDAGEITDKGYVNQRAVLARRADLVTALHMGAPATRVITA